MAEKHDEKQDETATAAGFTGKKRKKRPCFSPKASPRRRIRNTLAAASAARRRRLLNGRPRQSRFPKGRYRSPKDSSFGRNRDRARGRKGRQFPDKRQTGHFRGKAKEAGDSRRRKRKRDTPSFFPFNPLFPFFSRSLSRPLERPRGKRAIPAFRRRGPGEKPNAKTRPAQRRKKTRPLWQASKPAGRLPENA